MKTLALFSFLLFSSFNIKDDCGPLPPLNKKMVQFVKEHLHQKVGRGECWDLAAESLNFAGATWDGDYGFGKVIDPKKDCVFAGDIIQFEGVNVEYEDKGTFYRQNYAHHTAIVFSVKEKNSFIMAEQNTNTSGKKVELGALQLKNITTGKYKVYRPVK